MHQKPASSSARTVYGEVPLHLRTRRWLVVLRRQLFGRRHGWLLLHPADGRLRGVRLATGNRLPVAAACQHNARSEPLRTLLHDHHHEHNDHARAVRYGLHMAGEHQRRVDNSGRQLRPVVRLPASRV